MRCPSTPPPPTAISTLSLHDALPISLLFFLLHSPDRGVVTARPWGFVRPPLETPGPGRSEEHTSELQSRFDLVCPLLHEKKNNNDNGQTSVGTYLRLMSLVPDVNPMV